MAHPLPAPCLSHLLLPARQPLLLPSVFSPLPGFRSAMVTASSELVLPEGMLWALSPSSTSMWTFRLAPTPARIILISQFRLRDEDVPCPAPLLLSYHKRCLRSASDWLFVGQGATLTQQTVASSMALIPRLGDGNPFSFLSPVHGFIPIIWQPQDFEVEIITPIL